MVNCINLIIEMSPRFVLGWENVPCVAEVVNRSPKSDCTDFNYTFQHLKNTITQFGTQVRFCWSRDHNNRTAENAFSTPWYFSEMEFEPAAG